MFFLHNGTQLEGEKLKIQKSQNKDHPNVSHTSGTCSEPFSRLGSEEARFRTDAPDACECRDLI